MKEKFEKHINKIFKGIRETKEVKDIKEESKVSFILNIIILLVVILIHLNYFINSNLKITIDESMVVDKALYITQNYIYFGFMYLLLIINKFIKKSSF